MMHTIQYYFAVKFRLFLGTNCISVLNLIKYLLAPSKSSQQHLMSTQVGAANSSISVQELSATIVHVPVLPPILKDVSCSEIIEKGQVFTSVDEFFNGAKTITSSHCKIFCSLL